MTLKETMALYFEGNLPSLYGMEAPSDGLPTPEKFFEVCKQLEEDWNALVYDGGFYRTNEGLEVWWLYAFGHTYAAFPELDSYYRWKGSDQEKPISKAHSIEGFFWEQQDMCYRLSGRYGRE